MPGTSRQGKLALRGANEKDAARGYRPHGPPGDTANADIARAIQGLRLEARLTQKELAELIGTTASVVCRLEDARYEGHSVAMLRALRVPSASMSKSDSCVLQMLERAPETTIKVQWLSCRTFCPERSVTMQRENSGTADKAGTLDGSSERWPIPAEWCWSHVSDVGVVIKSEDNLPRRSGGVPKRPRIPCAANIGANGVDLTQVSKMDLTDRERESLALSRGDVVLSEASGALDQVGKNAVWNEEIPGCCFQNTVLRFRPTPCSPHMP